MITVAELQKYLADSIVPDNFNFLDWLNEVIEQFMTSGKWKGAQNVVIFPSSTGYITLPRGYSSILGATVNDFPIGIWNGFHEFIETGWGNLNPDLALSQLTENGYWPVQVPQSGATLVRLKTQSAADNNKTVRLFGLDQNGREIFGGDGRKGHAITLSYPQVTTAIPILLHEASKPLTSDYVDVYEVNGSDEKQIGSWQPTELSPSYHRYKIGTHESSEIRCLCQRQFIKLTHSSDVVVPSNLRAIKIGLMAVEAEYRKSIDDAGKYWGNAYNILNSEVKIYSGNEKKSPVAFRPWGKRRMNISRLR